MRLGATLVALALAATACGGDDGDDGDSGDEGASGGSFSLYIGEPENPLVPTNTSETSGGEVIDVNVIPDAGAVRGWVVGSEDLNVRTLTECDL